jgi:cytochrome b involved in lipid metabolism
MYVAKMKRLAAGAVVPMALAAVLVAPPAQAVQSGGVDTIVPSKSYSMAQVKRHKTARDCWSVVGRSVYNLTAWIPKHPGGRGTVTAMCGKKATKSFNSQHKNSRSAKASLAKYRIGRLR